MWNWIKMQWKYVLVGLAVAGAFLAGIFVRRPRPSPPSPQPPVGPSDTQTRADTATATQVHQAEVRHDAEVKQVEQEHEAKVNGMTAEQLKTYESLSNNPDAAAAFLLSVGQGVRGQG